MLVRVTYFSPNLPAFRALWISARASVFVGEISIGKDYRRTSSVRGLRWQKMLSRTLEKPSGSELIKNFVQDEPISNIYELAMEALSSLITTRKRGEKSNVGGKFEKLERMQMYIKILGLETHVSKLNIIHVAGTKGKGSTCSFCEAILRNCGFRTGLFTSPHLIDVRERIRVDGLDVSEEKFLLYFWDCWNQLQAHVTEELPMPPLFQFLAVLAFKIFVGEQVDVAIIEVGLGGKKDSTNFIMEPTVCGIASLGMDHTEALGNTLSKIASHKAGIFKPHVPAFTAPQLPEAMESLLSRAHELQVPLIVADPLDPRELSGVKLSLAGDHQYINAGLAVSLCKSWLKTTGNWEYVSGEVDELPAAFRRGLSSATLAGRGQIISDSVSKFQNAEGKFEDSLCFYLDGAHSPESMDACANWFCSGVDMLPSASRGCHTSNEIQINSIQILLFNCMDVRDPQILLPRLVNTCATSGVFFSKAIFVPSISSHNKVASGSASLPSDFSTKDLSWQLNLQKIWEAIIHERDHDRDSRSINENVYKDTSPPSNFLLDDASPSSVVISSLPSTIEWLRDCAREDRSTRIQVLVTGSLHLVGDVLKVLGR